MSWAPLGSAEKKGYMCRSLFAVYKSVHAVYKLCSWIHNPCPRIMNACPRICKACPQITNPCPQIYKQCPWIMNPWPTTLGFAIHSLKQFLDISQLSLCKIVFIVPFIPKIIFQFETTNKAAVNFPGLFVCQTLCHGNERHLQCDCLCGYEASNRVKTTSKFKKY